MQTDDTTTLISEVEQHALNTLINKYNLCHETHNLYVSYKRLILEIDDDTIPIEVTKLNSLKSLELLMKNLKHVPESIKDLQPQRIIVCNCDLDKVSDNLFTVETINTLEIYNCLVNTAFTNICNISNLKNLKFTNTEISTSFSAMTKLENLVTLEIVNCKLQEAPEEFANLKSLQLLNLSSNEIEQLPNFNYNLPRLYKIILSNNYLQYLPSKLVNFLANSGNFLNIDVTGNHNIALFDNSQYEYGIIKCCKILQKKIHFDPEYVIQNVYFSQDQIRSMALEEKITFLRYVCYYSSFTSYLELKVARNNILEDTVKELLSYDKHSVYTGKLHITYTDEIGIDQGGLTKDWFEKVIERFMNVNEKLFTYIDDNETRMLPFYRIIPNDDSLNEQDGVLTEDDKCKYQCLGIVMGLGLKHDVPLPLKLHRSVYMYIMDQKVTYEDMELIDNSFYEHCKYILNESVSDLGLYFCADCGLPSEKVVTVNLKPNGENIEVTNFNKKEYIDLLVDFKYTSGIKQQLERIKYGFFEAVSGQILDFLTVDEFEQAICGQKIVSLEIWKKYTKYTTNGDTVVDENEQVIKWFWEIFAEFERRDQMLIYQFITGSSSFSYGEGNNIVLNRVITLKDEIPVAHTCYNTLDLSNYSSKEILKEKIQIILENFSTLGFDIA